MLYLCGRNCFDNHNSKTWSGSRSDTRPFFLCFITYFRAKNAKKCKKMQKNAKKLQKNLHISKKCCTFAPNLKNNPISNQKN